ncbi:hypothetical protein L7F22_035948 [Adiantum nelumboides]|nr:hypothetical protein [Adiantum nelumboides]
MIPASFPWPSRPAIVGHLHLLGASPHRALCDLGKRHCSLMYLRFCCVPVVVASIAKVAMELLGCKNVLFSQFSPYWKGICQLYVKTASKRLEAFRPLIAEEMKGLLRAISAPQSSAQQNIEQNGLLVCAMLYKASANIISRMVLGKPWR